MICASDLDNQVNNESHVSYSMSELLGCVSIIHGLLAVCRMQECPCPNAEMSIPSTYSEIKSSLAVPLVLALSERASGNNQV